MQFKVLNDFVKSKALIGTTMLKKLFEIYTKCKESKAILEMLEEALKLHESVVVAN